MLPCPAPAVHVDGMTRPAISLAARMQRTAAFTWALPQFLPGVHPFHTFTVAHAFACHCSAWNILNFGHSPPSAIPALRRAPRAGSMQYASIFPRVLVADAPPIAGPLRLPPTICRVSLLGHLRAEISFSPHAGNQGHGSRASAVKMPWPSAEFIYRDAGPAVTQATFTCGVLQLGGKAVIFALPNLVPEAP